MMPGYSQQRAEAAGEASSVHTKQVVEQLTEGYSLLLCSPVRVGGNQEDKFM